VALCCLCCQSGNAGIHLQSAKCACESWLGQSVAEPAYSICWNCFALQIW
jgi:hypothetical protein